MHQLGSYIRRRNQKIRSDLSLNAQVPLLRVGRLHVEAAVLEGSALCEWKVLVLDDRQRVAAGIIRPRVIETRRERDVDNSTDRRALRITDIAAKRRMIIEQT